MATPRIAGRAADIPGTGSANFSGSPPDVPRGADFPTLSSGPIKDLRGRGDFQFVWSGLPALIAIPKGQQDRLRQARDRALAKLADEMVEYAQENAPWQDVTGDARAYLNSPGITEQANGDRVVTLAHGVSYGMYLETRDGGALGIIVRTIQTFAPQVPQRIADELARP